MPGAFGLPRGGAHSGDDPADDGKAAGGGLRGARAGKPSGAARGPAGAHPVASEKMALLARSSLGISGASIAWPRLFRSSVGMAAMGGACLCGLKLLLLLFRLCARCDPLVWRPSRARPVLCGGRCRRDSWPGFVAGIGLCHVINGVLGRGKPQIRAAEHGQNRRSAAGKLQGGGGRVLPTGVSAAN